MKYLLLITALLFPVLVHTQTLPGVGFVTDTIWYSQEEFFAGDTVRIYTTVRNSSTDDVSGTVTFFANDDAIGSTPFSVVRGQASTYWIDWTATEGKQTITAEITESFVTANGEQTAVTLGSTQTGKSTRTISTRPVEEATLEVSDTPSGEEGSNLTAAIADYTPEVVSDSLDSAGEVTESFREKQIESFTERVNNLESQFEGSSPMEVFRNAWEAKDIKSPFQYIWLFISKVILWILERPWWFYIVGILFILWFIRFLYRKFVRGY